MCLSENLYACAKLIWIRITSRQQGFRSTVNPSSRPGGTLQSNAECWKTLAQQLFTKVKKVPLFAFRQSISVSAINFVFRRWRESKSAYEFVLRERVREGLREVECCKGEREVRILLVFCQHTQRWGTNSLWCIRNSLSLEGYLQCQTWDWKSKLLSRKLQQGKLFKTKKAVIPTVCCRLGLHCDFWIPWLQDHCRKSFLLMPTHLHSSGICFVCGNKTGLTKHF